MKRFLCSSFTLALMTMLAASALVFSASPQAHACSCAAVDQAENVANADVIVSGAYASLETTKGEMKTIYQVEVDKVYKGEANSILTVSTSSRGSSCGWSGYNGEHFLLFLNEDDDGMLTTGLCSGNLENPTEEELGAIEKLTGHQGVNPIQLTPDIIKEKGEAKKAKALQNNTVQTLATVGALFFVLLICISSYRIIYKRIVKSSTK